MGSLPFLDNPDEHGLVFASDDTPGILRKRWGRGFSYFHSDGKKVTDSPTLHRIKGLVLPPQWEEVWISPLENGYLQATGRDALRRKQYRYHDRYIALRQNYKFNKLPYFAETLPSVREATAAYLRQRRWTREKVLALVVAVLDDCGIRIGNQAYRQRNGTVGLTTLRRKHLQLKEDGVVFQYPAKSGKRRKVQLSDDRLAKLVKRCSELPGYEVFCYMDEEGKRQPVDSQEVNEFIQQLAGKHFSSKDFRTWTATALAVYYYDEARQAIQENPRRKLDTVLVQKVAADLGNTTTVCRKYYIHPTVLARAADEKLPSFNRNPEEESFFFGPQLRSWEKVALEVMR